MTQPKTSTTNVGILAGYPEKLIATSVTDVRNDRFVFLTTETEEENRQKKFAKMTKQARKLGKALAKQQHKSNKKIKT